MNEIGSMEQEAIERKLAGDHPLIDREIRLDGVHQLQLGELVIYTVLTDRFGLAHIKHAEQRVAFFYRGEKRWDMIAAK